MVGTGSRQIILLLVKLTNKHYPQLIVLLSWWAVCNTYGQDLLNISLQPCFVRRRTSGYTWPLSSFIVSACKKHASKLHKVCSVLIRLGTPKGPCGGFVHCSEQLWPRPKTGSWVADECVGRTYKKDLKKVQCSQAVFTKSGQESRCTVCTVQCLSGYRIDYDLSLNLLTQRKSEELWSTMLQTRKYMNDSPEG